MSIFSTSPTLVLLLAGTAAVGATGGRDHRLPPRTATVTKTAYTPSMANGPRAAALLSVNLAAFGSSVTSPRGPYRARPRKIAFDLGGYYGAGTHGLWIDHLTWVGWGQPVAYASGVVHARDWPSHNFTTTPGGIMVDELRSCGTRAYYTYAAMLAPAGYPENTESTSVGTNEQALTPCLE